MTGSRKEGVLENQGVFLHPLFLRSIVRPNLGLFGLA
jgi:hypothetical protein